jgi:hypothetical protein
MYETYTDLNAFQVLCGAFLAVGVFASLALRRSENRDYLGLITVILLNILVSSVLFYFFIRNF